MRRRAAVVIMADGFSLWHAREHGGASLLSFLDSASIAVANSRTADGGDRLLSAAATLGAGRRMGAREWAGYGLGRDELVGKEQAADIYLRRMGEEAALSAGEILCLGYPELEAMGRQSPYRGKPGLIGESLRLAGLTAAAVGNSDADGEMVRPAVLLVMDAKGRVAGGAVGSEVIASDPTAPFGISCNVPVMAQAVADALTQMHASVVAVDFGDMNRLARYVHNLSSQASAEQLSECYRRLDELLGAMFEAAGPPSQDLAYILLAPGEPSSLAPVAIAGWQYPRGMLSSDTTRRRGLVTNLDLAATILNGLGVPEAWSHDGMPMTGLAADRGEDVALNVVKMAQFLEAGASSRVSVLGAFIGMVVIAVFSILAAVLLGPRTPALFVRATKLILLAVATQPLLILLAPILKIQGFIGSILFAVMGSILIALVLQEKIPSCMWSSVAIAVATAVAILADAFTRGTLAATSLLGHSAVVGARYYGIGNELMGVLTGSTAISLAAAGELYMGGVGLGRGLPKAIAGAAIGMGVVCVLIGHPEVGANFGGMVTAAVVASFMGTMSVARSGLPRRAKFGAVVAIILLATTVCAGMAWADAQGRRSSHIGRAWRLLTEENRVGIDALDGSESFQANVVDGVSSTTGTGLSQLGAIVLRKLGMNMRLLRYTAWTRVLLAFLISLTVLAARPFGFFRRCRDYYPTLYASFMGGLAGALAALAVNDSGVVACATVAMMPTFTLLAYVVDEILAEGA